MAAQMKIAASTDTTISIFTTDEAGQRRLVTTISIEAGNETSLSVANGAEVSVDVHSTVAANVAAAPPPATPPPPPTAPVAATATPVSSAGKTGIRSTATVTGS